MKNLVPKRVMEYIVITFAVILMDVGIYVFKFPNNFSFGGVSGMAVVFSHFIPMTSAQINLVINLILLVIGFMILGKDFGMKTAYVTVVSSLLLNVFEKVFPMEAKLNDDLIYAFSKIAIMEYLTSGITSNFDMYISPNPVIQASIDCGFRTVMTGGLNNFTQTVEEIDECYKKYNGYNPLISYELGFHAEYTCSRELLEGMASIAKKHQAPVFCHNSETKKEVKECLDRYGTTPTVFLDRLGIFNNLIEN